MTFGRPSPLRTTEIRRHGGRYVQSERRDLRFERNVLRASVSPWFVTVAAVAILMSRGVSALTVLPTSFAEMVSGSQLIVHGRVLDVRSQAINGRRSIESVVTVAVIESFKGNPGREVIFRMPNGEVGRYRHIVVGAPEFAPGQEVVLFLAGQAPALPLPFGLSQGVFRVGQGADGRAVVASLLMTDFARRVRAATEAR
jgi:hypothetical protein